jgi:hypothetical protein
MRPIQTYDLRQRPALTSLQLVHTGEVTGSIPIPPSATIRPRDRPVTFTQKVCLELGTSRTIKTLLSQVRNTFHVRRAAHPPDPDEKTGLDTDEQHHRLDRCR